jgi:pimeloyl-ACP methyl ester carboxylesterase
MVAALQSENRLTRCLTSALLAAAIASPLPALAQGPGGAAASSATAGAPTASFTVGTLTVQRFGDHGRPVILIPGLASGAWVWDATREHLVANHVVYTVTLAGFDGIPLPNQPGNLIDRADSSLTELIRTRRIRKPILIGHSLGGTLAIRIATEHPELISGVIAADGLPIFPGAEHMTPAQLSETGQDMLAQMGNAAPELFRSQQLGYMRRVGVINPDTAAKYARLTARSDPMATAIYATQNLSVDLRSRLKRATVPILEISPYFAADLAAPPMSLSEEQKTAYYEKLLAGAPDVKVVSISPSRHFVMLDQPRRFLEAVDGFLERLR